MRKSFALLFAASIVVAMLVGTLSPVFADSAAENSWISKAPMQQARSGAGVAVLNEKIYAIGGLGKNGVVGTNEEYDPATDTWVYKTPMPTPMRNFATAVYNNKIFCISEGVNVVYDPATDTWESRAPMPEAQWVGRANVVGDRIYVIGGLPDRTLNQVYDPASDTWTIKASMPIDAGGASVVFNNKIYVIGGFFDGPGWRTVTQIYDPVTDSWVSGAGIPTRRSSFSVAIVDDLFYVIGGSLATYGEFPIGWTQPPKITYYATNERYTPFGYGTVAPKIGVISPEGTIYFEGEVSLVFVVNRPVSWMAYSLSGQEKVVVEGNVTLGVLSEGLYNVTVYAVDMFGNLGSSETISFTVAKPELPEPASAGLSVPVVAASGATIAIAAVSLIYYKKRHKQVHRG